MIFIMIRIIVCFGVCIAAALCIQKPGISQKRRRIALALAAGVVLTTLSALFPVENAFITFSSAESSYHYTNVGKVNLTVSGEQTDLVVAQKGNANSLLIIPKSEDGWKIGIGVYTKSAFYTASNGATVRVYRYKNSSDYYVEVLDSAGDKAEVTDNCNSEFHSVERFNTALDKNCYTYYAYVSNLDDTYTVLVDGAAITVTR